MVTVWIFFGSAEPGAGTAAGAGGLAATAGADEASPGEAAGGKPATGAGAVGQGEPGVGPLAGGAGLCADVVGMAETTRGVVGAGSILTGCSSRETTFSLAPALAALAWLELFGCASP